MEASGAAPEQGTGEPQDKQEGVQAHDPSQSNPTELTEEQRQQAEADAIKGDQGPLTQDAPPAGATGVDQNTPVRTSAPDPARQSGVPLEGDRAAGVEPGPVNPGDQQSGERPAGADQTSPSAAEPTE